MKDEMKQKMSEKMKDMKCCPKEEQKEPKTKYPCFSSKRKRGGADQGCFCSASK